MLNILLRRYGVDQGILEWDANAGTFAGYEADKVRACAGFPQSHPAFPFYEGTAEKDPIALAILLVCLGWDVPADLAPSLEKWLEGYKGIPEDAIS